jgi:hypothetical protein
MKKYVEIFWTPFSANPTHNWINLAFSEPKPFYPILQKARPSALYLKCPAVAESFKNDFVISSPVDLVITVDYENRVVTTDRYGDNFYDAFVENRVGQFEAPNPYLLSIPPKYLFYSNDDVELEVKDLPILTSKSSSNFKLIPGRFNIGKWHRPIDTGVECIDPSKPIELVRDDPLYAIRFITKNNVPVKLTRVDLDLALRKKVDAFISLKNFLPKLKLKEMYELAENYLSSMTKK